jgi:hypothetical protein
MAAPNIVNVATITGVTTCLTLTGTAPTSFVSNAAASNKVFKINTLVVSNIDGTNAAEITVKWHQAAAAGAGTSVSLVNTVVVPADASLVVIGKDNPIYLEENRSLSAQASVANDLAVVCSYEEIS